MRVRYLAGMGTTEQVDAQRVDSAEPVPHKTIDAIRKISEEEWRVINEALRRVELHGKDDFLFQIYAGNAAELFRFLDQCLNDMENNPSIGPQRIRTMYAESQRHVLNLLASMRTFLDHTETMLKRRFGETSALVQLFKKECSHQYDSHFAYRFLSRSRNFAQHCGLPVGHLSVTARSQPRPLVRRPMRHASHAVGHHQIALSMDPKDLLAEFSSWGAQVRSELEKRTSRLELVGLVRQLNRSVSIIHSRVRHAIGRSLRADARRLNALVHEVYVERPGMYPMMLSHAESTGGNDKMQMQFHPFHVGVLSELLPKDEWLHKLSEVDT